MNTPTQLAAWIDAFGGEGTSAEGANWTPDIVIAPPGEGGSNGRDGAAAAAALIPLPEGAMASMEMGGFGMYSIPYTTAEEVIAFLAENPEVEIVSQSGPNGASYNLIIRCRGAQYSVLVGNAGGSVELTVLQE